MKNEDKFFNLLSRIENELDKLKYLNDNLSQVNNYVIEVSSIKKNILNSVKELILEYQKNQKNLFDFYKKEFNVIDKKFKLITIILILNVIFTIFNLITILIFK